MFWSEKLRSSRPKKLNISGALGKSYFHTQTSYFVLLNQFKPESEILKDTPPICHEPLNVFGGASLEGGVKVFYFWNSDLKKLPNFKLLNWSNLIQMVLLAIMKPL